MATTLIKTATLAAAAAVSVAATSPARAQGADAGAADKAAIESTLNAYQDALNAADTKAVLPLYEADGIFMQPYGPSVIGTEAIRKAYDGDFHAFRLDVKFHIAELVVMAPDWAFVRTNSAGTNTVNATRKQSAEGNQELFIFHKGSDSKWRIARYSFSTTNPQPH